MLEQAAGILATESVVGVTLAFGAAVAISLLTLSVRVGTASEGGRALNVLFVVLLTNVVVLVPGALLFHHADLGMTTRSVAAFAIAGITGTMIGRALTYTSIERIGASRTEPIKSSQPLHATAIAVVVLGETVTPPHLLGVVLVVVGVAVVSWELARSSAESRVDANLAALAIPFTAALFYGVEPIFAKVGFAEGTPVVVGLAIKTVAALVGYLVYAFARGSVPNPLQFEPSLRRWYVVAGLLNTAFLVLYYMALEVAPVSIVVPIVTTSPVLVVVFSWAFLPRLERISWRLGAAAFIVAVGAVLTTAFG
jgi:drug/metabolite transporter (DMT)-like permease